MSQTLGPLPPPNVPADCELSDDFCAYDDWYSAEQMEAERQRCFDLGVSKASQLWQSLVFAWWEIAREGACDMDPDEHEAWERVGELFGQLRVIPNVQPTSDHR